MCVCARSSAVPGRRLPWFSVVSCPRRPALLRRLLHVPPAHHRPHCPRRRSRHPARRRACLPHRLRHPLAPRLLLLRPPSFLPVSALLRLLLFSSVTGPYPRLESLRLPRRPLTLPLPAPLPVPRRPRLRLRPAYLVLLVTLLLVCRPTSCCPSSPTSALLSPCLPFLLPSSFVLPSVGVVVVIVARAAVAVPWRRPALPPRHHKPRLPPRLVKCIDACTVPFHVPRRAAVDSVRHCPRPLQQPRLL